MQVTTEDLASSERDSPVKSAPVKGSEASPTQGKEAEPHQDSPNNNDCVGSDDHGQRAGQDTAEEVAQALTRAEELEEEARRLRIEQQIREDEISAWNIYWANPDPSGEGAGNGSNGSNGLCCVCMEAPSEVVAEPCEHSSICYSCVTQLAKRRCPVCRDKVRTVRKLAEGGGEGQRFDLRDIVAEKEAERNKDYADTLQILIVGPPKVGRKSLQSRILAAHRRKRDSVAREDESQSAEELRRTGSSNAEGQSTAETYQSFAPNCIVGEQLVRVSVSSRTTPSSRNIIKEDLNLLKPDCIIICCSLHNTKTFESLMLWDRVLRAQSSSIPRLWALLEKNANEPTRVDPRDTVGSAYERIPEEIRPAGHYVCAPHSWINPGTTTLVREAVRVGRHYRGVRDQPKEEVGIFTSLLNWALGGD